MTCVVAVADGGGVHFGGDSAITSDDELAIQRDPKVFRRGPYVIGYSGSLRWGSILRYVVPLPTPPRRGVARMLNLELSAELAVALAQARVKADQALLGVSGELYWIDEDLAFVRLGADYGAIGSGAAYALGALSVLDHRLPPKRRLRHALEAAAHHCPSVQGPWRWASHGAAS